GLSPSFRAMFGITDEKQVENLGALPMEQVFEDKNGSGSSITVKELVADQDRLYILMEFSAPEGIVLPKPEAASSDLGYWIYGNDSKTSIPRFFADEACTKEVPEYGGYSSGSRALTDDDPTDNRIPILYTLTTDRGFSPEAQYCRIPNISTLWTQAGGEAVPILEDMDIAISIPMRSATKSYSFDGRCGVNLGGDTLAVVENLSISPISISLDLIMPDSTAYDTVFDQQWLWPVYVLLGDGTRVAARQPEQTYGRLDQYRSQDGTVFFRADHILLTLEHPIDVSEIADIVFVGDNDPPDEQEPGRIVYFMFTPGNFFNNTYWNEVNQIWRKTKE
ncbi:MAG: DUF4179 domain-containing protein, partial [Oscillospiraceae bacterium]